MGVACIVLTHVFLPPSRKVTVKPSKVGKLARMFKRGDKNQLGFGHEPTEDELRQAFALYDEDGSGSMDMNEVRGCIERQFKTKLSDEEAAELLAKFDVDGDHLLE